MQTDPPSPVPATELRKGSFEEGGTHQTQVQERVALRRPILPVRKGNRSQCGTPSAWLEKADVYLGVVQERRGDGPAREE
ncbi:MAG: hypothetical protein M3Z66_17090 [Chloroflexota bacterium]|nr:hypothetical protein [Chloroflexota bacterium]